MAVAHSLHPEAGSVTIDREACSHCAQCASVCPTEVLQSNGAEVTIHPEATFGCIACGQCMMVCPNGSVTVRGRGISPDDLFPLPEPGTRSSAEALLALLRSRRSVRRFRDEDLALDAVKRILDAASTGPMGIPPWDVGCVVVHGRQAVRELSADVVAGYERMQRLFRPWVLSAARPFMKKTTYDAFRTFILPLARAYVDGHRSGRDLVFYGAPAVLIFHHSPLAEGADATIACTYAMLAAESMGLGTTMIGGAPPIIQHDPALARRLGIPSGNRAALCLIVGHPATRYRRGIRRRFTSVTVLDARGQRPL